MREGEIERKGLLLACAAGEWRAEEGRDRRTTYIADGGGVGREQQHELSAPAIDSPVCRAAKPSYITRAVAKLIERRIERLRGRETWGPRSAALKVNCTPCPTLIR